MARCRFRPRAESDLDEIWLNIARNSLEAADRMLDRIRARCDLQAETFPEGGEAQDNLIPGLRRLIVGRYLIFYFPRLDGIEVVRILDGRRDIEAVFEQP